MSGRRTSLSHPPALLFGVVALCLGAERADAHRMDAQAFLLPDKQVQIEAWFSTGQAAKGAKVDVLHDKGQLLLSGQLNHQGVFLFRYTEAEPLTVVVDAGGGHRKVLSLSARELTQVVSQDESKLPAELEKERGAPGPLPIGTHEYDVPIKDILIGTSFILALAAFLLSLRNARRLKDLRSQR